MGCNSVAWIYGQLAGERCNSVAWVYGQLAGGRCNGLAWIYGQLAGGQSFIDPCYTITSPPLNGPYIHVTLLHPISLTYSSMPMHFIWQVDLVEHFIWKVDLILWLFQMGSHCRHRWGKSWSAVTGSFGGGYMWQLIWVLHLKNMKIWTHIWCPCALHLTMWGIADSWSGHLSENMNSYLMFICTSSCSLHLTAMGDISVSLSGHFIWKFEHTCHFMLCFTEGLFILHMKDLMKMNLNTSSENMNSFLVLVSVVHIIWEGGYIWICTIYLNIWTHFWFWSQLCTLSEKEGYIWSQCALHLTSWPNCSLHLKTWPHCNDHFKWGLTENIDQMILILDVLSLTVSQGVHLICTLHLKIRSFHIKYELY